MKTEKPVMNLLVVLLAKYSELKIKRSTNWSVLNPIRK
jgi:hypothetical protein